MIKPCPVCQNQHDDTMGACPEHQRATVSTIISEDRLIGKMVRDRYKITELLGKGAMGVVYKATQLNDGKDVALKVLHTHLSSDPESIKRFQYEAKAASSLMHPNIVRLYDFGMMPSGQPYIAMEFLEGRTLAEIIRDKRYYRTKDALPIVRQVCEALAEAHSHGVLHRDIKPANIMLMNRFGQENFVVVLDFSISKVIQKVSDVDTTTPGLVFGSPAYMSPERFMGGGGDFRADIYSLGVIMFQMLAGRAPFKSADLYALMNDVVSTAPPDVKALRPESDIPDSLQQTITRALAKQPKDRQPNMKAMLAEINDVYLETSSMTSPVATVPAEAPAVAARSTSSNAGTPSRNEMPIFDIDPGLTPPLSLPALDAQARKIALSNESSQLRTTDLTTSGKWDKSLIVKTENRQRPSIRPPEQTHGVPPELLALIVVMMIGLGAIFITLMPASNASHAQIRAYLKSDNLPAAVAALAAWHPLESNAAELDLYGEACLTIGKTFMHKKELESAVSVLEAVPATSKATAEAHLLLRQCRKPQSAQPP